MSDARPTFRRRLLVRTGLALAAVLAFIGVLVWVAAYALLTYNARSLLDAEVEEIRSEVLRPGLGLDVNAYNWDEPHHRFTGRHVDPYFLQVFAADGTLLRASENVAASGAAYPDRLLAAQPAPDGLLPALQTFRVGGELRYYTVEPLVEEGGRVLGFVQVARREPGIAVQLRRTALALVVGLGLTLAGLLLLVRRIAAGVVDPLETITEAARGVAADRLSRRIPLPPSADRETAQLAATLNALLARLEQSFDEMQRFTSDAAHELQTPLTVLQGHVEVALRRPRSPEAYRETLALLQREIESLTKMVQSLLRLARLDGDAPALPHVAVDLVPLVADEMERLAPCAGAKGLTLEADLPSEALVLGRAELLREVVHNVLDNAVKYTPAGSVRAALAVADGLVRLVVEDTGIGIDPSSLPHVTDRFFRAPVTDRLQIPGSGLGLSLTEQIISRHGGRLRVESTPGEGTRVTVDLEAPAP